jgi:hypothetical protein
LVAGVAAVAAAAEEAAADLDRLDTLLLLFYTPLMVLSLSYRARSD